MKTLIFSLLVLVVVGFAVSHYYPEQVEPLLGGTPLEGLASTSNPLYQWRDKHGQWQITDKLPPRGIPYEIRQYALDANVVPAFEQEKD